MEIDLKLDWWPLVNGFGAIEYRDIDIPSDQT
jgi:hypothetical protein